MTSRCNSVSSLRPNVPAGYPLLKRFSNQVLPEKPPFLYNSYGASCAEVELDVLTGEYQVNRVDIVFDCGERYGGVDDFSIYVLYNSISIISE